MRLLIPSRYTIILLLYVVGCVAGCATTPQQPLAKAHAVVESYVDAINHRDLLKLTLYVTPDVEWYSVANGERTLESSGREPLAQLLKQYFDRYRVTRWNIERFIETEDQVALIERSEWGNESTEARIAMGVFELDHDRIKRITYYLNDR